MIQVDPTSIPSTKLEEVSRWIRDKLTASNVHSCLRVVSLYVQHHSGVSNAAPPDAPLHHLFGLLRLEETLLGLKFQLSPTAFFQVNTGGAEVLYAKVRALATACVGAETDKITVFDVCCGTGTIGLCVAAGLPSARIIGIDIVKEAVDDANANASRSGLKNAQFFAGKAEDILPRVLKTSTQELKSDPQRKFVAIVDPPRAGLHSRVVKAIRDSEFIDSLIYVSCNQKSLVNDASGLCRAPSSNMPGREFEPVSAIPVDLFPHTPHCELILYFERRKAPQEPST